MCLDGFLSRHVLATAVIRVLMSLRATFIGGLAVLHNILRSRSHAAYDLYDDGLHDIATTHARPSSVFFFFFSPNNTTASDTAYDDKVVPMIITMTTLSLQAVPGAAGVMTFQFQRLDSTPLNSTMSGITKFPARLIRYCFLSFQIPPVPPSCR